MRRAISISGLIGLLIGIWAVTHQWMGTPANPWQDVDHTLGVVVLMTFACVLAGIFIHRSFNPDDNA